MVRRGIRRFGSDERGAVLVEALIVINVVLLVLVAFMELTVAVNQWNMAVKSLQVGARLASVSDPVDPTLLTLDQADPANNITPGDPSLSFTERRCSAMGCTGTNQFDAAAFQRIHGIQNGECPPPPRPGAVRMCHFLPRMQPDNLEIRYTWGGLGYINRPGGAVPIISLTLSNVSFNFLILGAFIGQDTITMPDLTVTAVAEDFMTTYD